MCGSIKKIIAGQPDSALQKGPLTVGDSLPEFVKKAVFTVNDGTEIMDIQHTYASALGKWTVLFWWPKDFTFVCPTEIVEFDAHQSEFEKRNTLLIGASTDSEYVHLAWRKNDPQLSRLQIPMLADTSKSLAESMGILELTEKVAYRATFIVDPKGIIQWVSIYPMNVGRNVQEVLRVLDALQTDELTACGWTVGQKTISQTRKEMGNA